MADFITEDGKKTVLDAAKALIERNFEGVELVEGKFFKEYGDNTLELFIWSKRGISLDDCERVHEATSDMLDGYDDLFSSTYNLKISSMGLDRPITNDEDFRRALGVEIECRDENKKKSHGVLKSYDSEHITLETEKGDVTLNRKFLTKVQPYVRF